MHPLLAVLFGEEIPAYAVLIGMGFLFAVSVGALWAKEQGLRAATIVDLGLLSVLLGVAGARLLHVLADGHLLDYIHLCTDPSLVDIPEVTSRAVCEGPYYQGLWDASSGHCHPKQDCFRWAKFWAGGLTFYGGLIAAGLGAFWLFKRDRFPIRQGFDMGGMCVPIGLGFGRLGCLLGGCCFGSRCSLPWALHFPGGSPASFAQHESGELASTMLVSFGVHPTQLYEAFAAFLLSSFLIFVVHPRKRYHGQLFVLFLAGYATFRFLIEFLRADERGDYLLSTSQWIALCGIILAFFLGKHWKASVTP